MINSIIFVAQYIVLYAGFCFTIFSVASVVNSILGGSKVLNIRYDIRNISEIVLTISGLGLMLFVYLAAKGVPFLPTLLNIITLILSSNFTFMLLSIIAINIICSIFISYNNKKAVVRTSRSTQSQRRPSQQASQPARSPADVARSSNVLLIRKAVLDSRSAREFYEHLKSSTNLLDSYTDASFESFVDDSRLMYYNGTSIMKDRVPNRCLSIYNQLCILAGKDVGLNICKIVGKRTYDDEYAVQQLGLLPGVLDRVIVNDYPPGNLGSLSPEEKFQQLFRDSRLVVKSLDQKCQPIFFGQLFDPTSYRPRFGSHDIRKEKQKWVFDPRGSRGQWHKVNVAPKSNQKKIGIARTDMQKNSFSLISTGSCNIFWENRRQFAIAANASECQIDDNYTWYHNAYTNNKDWYNMVIEPFFCPSSMLALQLSLRAKETVRHNELLVRPSLHSLVGVIALKQSCLSRLSALYSAETINCFNILQKNGYPHVPVMLKCNDEFSPYSLDQLADDVIECLASSDGQLKRRIKLICFKSFVDDYEAFKHKVSSRLRAVADGFIRNLPESYEQNGCILLRELHEYADYTDLSPAAIMARGASPRTQFMAEKVVLDRIKSTATPTSLRSSGR